MKILKNIQSLGRESLLAGKIPFCPASAKRGERDLKGIFHPTGR
jgi:hypothetical protein